MFTNEILSFLLDSVKSQISIIIPVAIGCFVLPMAVAFVPTIIKAFAMQGSSVSSTPQFEEYFEPYIIEEGDMQDGYVGVDGFLGVDYIPDGSDGLPVIDYIPDGCGGDTDLETEAQKSWASGDSYDYIWDD